MQRYLFSFTAQQPWSRRTVCLRNNNNTSKRWRCKRTAETSLWRHRLLFYSKSSISSSVPHRLWAINNHWRSNDPSSSTSRKIQPVVVIVAIAIVVDVVVVVVGKVPTELCFTILKLFCFTQRRLFPIWSKKKCFRLPPGQTVTTNC